MLAAVGDEVIVSDAKRTERSAVVFTGTVTNIKHLPLLVTNTVLTAEGKFSSTHDRGLWRAEVLVSSVTKQDSPLEKVAHVFFEQRPLPPPFGGRVSVGYPKKEPQMRATFWCWRLTEGVLTDVLYISMPSSVKPE